MKRNSVLLLFLFCLPLMATNTAPRGDAAPPAAGKPDVRKLRWGMTRAEVQQTELPLKPAGALGSRLEYRDTILTEQVTIIYSFQIDSLIAADLLFSPGPGREGALHRSLAQTLEDKYGKPRESLTGRYGQALYTKHLWELPATVIELSSISGRVKIVYTARKLQLKEPVYNPGSGDRDKL